jgi:hypothetical protein
VGGGVRIDHSCHRRPAGRNGAQKAVVVQYSASLHTLGSVWRIQVHFLCSLRVQRCMTYSSIYRPTVVRRRRHPGAKAVTGHMQPCVIVVWQIGLWLLRAQLLPAPTCWHAMQQATSWHVPLWDNAMCLNKCVCCHISAPQCGPLRLQAAVQKQEGNR